MPTPPDASTTLTRQLRQLSLQPDQPPSDSAHWLALLDTVGRTYEDFERQIAVAAHAPPDWEDTVSEVRESSDSNEGSLSDAESMAAWSWQPGDEALRITGALARLLGLPRGTRALPLTVWLSCLDDSDRELQCEYLMQAAQQMASFTGQLRCTPPHTSEQHWLYYELQSLPPADPASGGSNEPAMVRCSVLDITARMQSAQGRHGDDGADALTGVHNRARFFDIAAATRARAVCDGSRIGLLYMDVDGLNQLNERYGRDGGNRLLRGLAQRLRSTVRLGDQIGRLSGGEFALLVHPVENVQHLESITYKIQAAAAVPMDIGGECVSLSLSVGIALHPDDAASTLDLIRAGRRALLAAKQRGRGRCVIHEQLPPPADPMAAARQRAAAALAAAED